MERARVSSAPAKPLMVFDGDCNFCRYWILRWQQITRDRVDYLPFQDPRIAERFPELPVSRFEQAVQLIDTDGTVYSGAEAVFRSLAHGMRWPLWVYEHVPAVRPVTEFLYKGVARHRMFFSFFTRLLWGHEAAPARYVGARWLFLRLIGLTYVIAFISLWLQIIGLVGHNGILPTDQLMAALGRNLGGFGWKRFIIAPTFCWFRVDDAFLQLQCAAGTMLGLFVICGIAQKLSLFLLWAFYLSLTVVCNVFLSFQWDSLLLEAGLLAILFAPAGLRPNCERRVPVSKTGLWLLRWLLFRLMFSSACVKLLSGDPTWRNLTALNYHYETQPLPTWIGWHAHHLPSWWHTGTVVLMFTIELIVPFFIFLPRRARFLACSLFIVLQLGIATTGNYGFFNLLAILLCVVLLDDSILVRLAPAAWRPRLARRLESARSSGASTTTPIQSAKDAAVAQGPDDCADNRGQAILQSLGRIATGTVAAIVLIVSSMLLIAMFGWTVAWPRSFMGLYTWSSPFRSINNYGLFAIMTTNRPEIVVEGSADGETWLPYEFKWKAGDLKRRPAFVEPHQPRLDWQMWFAALGSYEENPWFINFCYRLLEGSTDVTRLLSTNPFPNAPPQYVRAIVYDYKFTDNRTRVRDGRWWRRELKGVYCPTLSRRAAIPGKPLLLPRP